LCSHRNITDCHGTQHSQN